MNSIKRRLIIGGTWVLSGRLVSIAATLVVNALVARLLLPVEMGAYFLTLSMVSICTVIAQLGLQQTVIRFVAESLGTNRPHRAARTIRLVFGFGTLGALSVAAILVGGGGTWLVARLANGELLGDVIMLIALWVVVATFQELLSQSFRGFQDIRLATTFGGVLTNILSLLLFGSLWLVGEHSNVRQVVILSVIAVTTNLLIGLPLLRHKLRGLGEAGDLKSREVIQNAWPLWVTSLTLIALTQADLWIIGIFRAGEEVAIYGAAGRLVALLAMPLTMANAVLPSFIAEMYVQGKRSDLEDVLRSTTTIAGMFALITLVAFVFFGNDILGVIYGDYYRAASTVLLLLSFGQFVNVWAGSCGLVLMMTGYQKILMWISVACGLLNITAALLTVKQYGVTGVATVAAVTMLIQNGLMLFFSKSKTGVWTHARLSWSPLHRALRP